MPDLRPPAAQGHGAMDCLHAQHALYNSSLLDEPVVIPFLTGAVAHEGNCMV